MLPPVSVMYCPHVVYFSIGRSCGTYGSIVTTAVLVWPHVHSFIIIETQPPGLTFLPQKSPRGEETIHHEMRRRRLIHSGIWAAALVEDVCKVGHVDLLEVKCEFVVVLIWRHRMLLCCGRWTEFSFWKCKVSQRLCFFFPLDSHLCCLPLTPNHLRQTAAHSESGSLPKLSVLLGVLLLLLCGIIRGRVPVWLCWRKSLRYRGQRTSLWEASSHHRYRLTRKLQPASTKAKPRFLWWTTRTSDRQ